MLLFNLGQGGCLICLIFGALDYFTCFLVVKVRIYRVEHNVWR